MTYFPKEVFSLVCNFAGPTEREKYDKVIQQLAKTKKDWLADYWEWYYDEGMYEWKLYGEYNRISLEELIDNVCVSKDICSPYKNLYDFLMENNDLNSHFEEDKLRSVCQVIKVILEG